MNFRRRSHPRPRPRAVPGAPPVVCHLCRATAEAGTEQYATVPGSCAVGRSATRRGGYRRLVACIPSHREIILLRAVDVGDVASVTGLRPHALDD